MGLNLIDFRDGGIEHVVVGTHNLIQTSRCQETRRKQFNKPSFDHETHKRHENFLTANERELA
jgi:hypothetical protein